MSLQAGSLRRSQTTARSAMTGGELCNAGDDLGELGVDRGGERGGKPRSEVFMAVADEADGDGGGL